MDTAYLLWLISCAACKKVQESKVKGYNQKPHVRGRELTWIRYVSYAEVSDLHAVSRNHTMDNFKSADVNNAVFRIFW